jgi:hypothetical protein
MKYVAVIAILGLPAIKLVHYYQSPSRPQWREAVSSIRREERRGDVIALYRPGNGSVFAYYYKGTTPWMEIGKPKVQKDRPWADKRVAELLSGLPEEYNRTWLVMSEHSPSSDTAITGYVRKKYNIIQFRRYFGVTVMLFRPRSTK